MCVCFCFLLQEKECRVGDIQINNVFLHLIFRFDGLSKKKKNENILSLSLSLFLSLFVCLFLSLFKPEIGK